MLSFFSTNFSFAIIFFAFFFVLENFFLFLLQLSQVIAGWLSLILVLLSYKNGWRKGNLKQVRALSAWSTNVLMKVSDPLWCISCQSRLRKLLLRLNKKIIVSKSNSCWNMNFLEAWSFSGQPIILIDICIYKDCKMSDLRENNEFGSLNMYLKNLVAPKKKNVFILDSYLFLGSIFCRWSLQSTFSIQYTHLYGWFCFTIRRKKNKALNFRSKKNS